MENSVFEQQENFVKRTGSKFIFTCLYCRKEFTSPGYEVRAGRRNKYCSNLCQNRSPIRRRNSIEARVLVSNSGDKNGNWKGGYYFYKQHRKEFCELCKAKSGSVLFGRIKNLSVHHKDKNHYNFRPSNLATLCHSCHIKVHRNKKGKYPEFQGW